MKRTPTSDSLLADSELRYPYEGSKSLMHVFDSFDDKALILELLEGIHLILYCLTATWTKTGKLIRCIITKERHLMGRTRRKFSSEEKLKNGNGSYSGWKGSQ